MNILIFIWRDLKNPNAGGSEIYFHELAKRWVKSGNSVTMLCGGWKGCKKRETLDGINIVRIGNALTLYLKAPFEYFKLKEKPDVIIDVENGLPFFTPLFTKEKKILHIHHMHRNVWFKEKNFLMATVGWLLETKAMPLVYRNSKIVTLSKSSKEEIQNEKFGNIIGIINPGIEFYRDYKKFKRNQKPTVLFLNRIKKYKGVDFFLEMAKQLKDKNYEFWIVGSGDALDKSKDYVNKNDLKNVKFYGRISEEKKIELMQKSWVFVNPSFKEGWGIVNIEANYFGLPVVGSNVSGIKDSIINGRTGLLFEYGNTEELSNKVESLLRQRKLMDKMSSNCKIWAKKFGWDLKAKEYLHILKNLMEKK